MKIRKIFVSNSSTCSYICAGVRVKYDEEEYGDLFDGYISSRGCRGYDDNKMYIMARPCMISNDCGIESYSSDMFTYFWEKLSKICAERDIEYETVVMNYPSYEPDDEDKWE